MTYLGNFRSKRGVAAIEFAIVLPVFLLFILGLIDAGRLMWTYNTVEYAVENAAVCAVTKRCATPGSVRQAFMDALVPLDGSLASVEVTSQTCGLSIRATYLFAFTIPGLSDTEATSLTCVPTP